MPLLDRALEMQSEIAAWRRELHAHPEILFDTEWTSGFVADKLGAFGCDSVTRGIGGTGVVGTIKGRLGKGPTIGFRADMDGLPITEETGLAYSSTFPGRMHGCGHDGHMAMLLGAARHLCDTRDFRGAVAVIFQPAEEGGAGGEAMVADGLMEKFDIARVYGMHNFPGIPVGQFATRKGGITASADVFRIVITGRGGHAAMPHAAVDPVHIASQVVIALQSIASRSVDPLESVVVSVTQFHAGEASNVIPQRAELTGTVRTLKTEVRSQARELLHRVTAGVTQALGGTAEINYDFEIGYPSTANHAAETDTAVRAARTVSGDGQVDDDTPPVMGAEDFAFMLRARPGNFMLIGNGDTAFCHHPAYDFNDAVIPYGVSYWVALARLELGDYPRP